MTENRPMRADVTHGPRPITRATATAVCELLNVDPSSVTRIVLTPGFVEVTELVLVPADEAPVDFDPTAPDGAGRE